MAVNSMASDSNTTLVKVKLVNKAKQVDVLILFKYNTC